MTALSLAREKVVRIALEVVVEERRLAERPAASRLAELDKQLAFAARDMARAVDELEPARKPKGWVEPSLPPDSRLISPQCKAGKHRACDGDRCECGCHHVANTPRGWDS